MTSHLIESVREISLFVDLFSARLEIEGEVLGFSLGIYGKRRIYPDILISIDLISCSLYTISADTGFILRECNTLFVINGETSHRIVFFSDEYQSRDLVLVAVRSIHSELDGIYSGFFVDMSDVRDLEIALHAIAEIPLIADDRLIGLDRETDRISSIGSHRSDIDLRPDH